MTRATGTTMHVEPLRVRLASGGRRGPKPGLNVILGTEKVPEIRRLLRTKKTIEEIASDLGVSSPTLRTFIKRRQLCDLTERRNFLLLQKSLLREEEKEGSQS